MTQADLALAIDWAAAEGWNPGLDDAGCFLAADAQGFLMSWLGDAPAACISVVRYGADYGFLGFYISPPAHRGRGHGWAVWQAGMDRLAGRTVGLDGVVDQQANYARSGFVLAHRNLRYGGRVAVDAPGAAEAAGRLVDASALPVADLIAYDRPFFPAPRDAFLSCWLNPAHRASLALIRDGAIAGYGTIRACREGFKIGPLFAEDAAGADLLFRGLAARANGEPVYLDPPEVNAAAVALARRYGLSPCFETARMYRGPAPALPLDRIFGITTFELG
ncbi:MAG: GNAT family N-acetyltransferase [Alphaproteobacteria bacterium]